MRAIVFQDGHAQETECGVRGFSQAGGMNCAEDLGLSNTRSHERVDIPAIARCSVNQPYRDSTISFSSGRRDLPEARELMIAIRNLLDQHLS